jgi:thiamine kinase-like enzyme
MLHRKKESLKILSKKGTFFGYLLNYFDTYIKQSVHNCSLKKLQITYTYWKKLKYLKWRVRDVTVSHQIIYHILCFKVIGHNDINK